jgi:excisionase family DNA binding protein
MTTTARATDTLVRALSRPRRLMTIRELSEYLSVPIGTLYTWRSNGDGPRGIKVGKHVRYRAADVERWLEERSGYASNEPMLAGKFQSVTRLGSLSEPDGVAPVADASARGGASVPADAPSSISVQPPALHVAKGNHHGSLEP